MTQSYRALKRQPVAFLFIRTGNEYATFLFSGIKNAMENGGTKTSKKINREFIKRISITLISGILLVFCSGYSFGWFSFDRKVGSDSMRVTVGTDSYDILVERTSEYGATYNYMVGSDMRSDMIIDKIADTGYDVDTETSTADASKIAYEMVNEYVYDGKRYLMPGAYGTVTFYLSPKTAGDFTAIFRLSFGGYVAVYDAENEVQVINAVESENVLNMLKGHILFFTERTGVGYANYKYDGLIEGSFLYGTQGKSKCSEEGKTDYYKVTLYWEWVNTYHEMVDNISDEETLKKYPAELMTYINGNPQYFFAATLDSNTMEAKSDAYNDGDQLIGNGVDCVVLYITA